MTEMLVIPCDLSDVFVCGVAKIEILQGAIARFYLFTERPQDDGTILKEIVLAIVVPLSSLEQATMLTKTLLAPMLPADRVGMH